MLVVGLPFSSGAYDGEGVYLGNMNGNGRERNEILTGRLDLATIHCEHDTRTPVQETGRDTFTDQSD